MKISRQGRSPPLAPRRSLAVFAAAYALGELWLGLVGKTLDFLMTLHEGGWLGKTYKPFYVILVGAGQAILIITGLSVVFRRKNSGAVNATT